MAQSASPFDVKNPFPLFRKLLLETKIQVFVTGIILVLSGIACLAAYWTLDKGLTRIFNDQLRTTGQSIRTPLSEALANQNLQRVQSILEEASRLDPRMSYALVSTGTDIVASYGPGDLLEKLHKASREDPSSQTRIVETGDRSFQEIFLSLPSQEGALLLGYDRSLIHSFLRKAGLAVFALMVIPLILAAFLARKSIRYAMQPLIELTHIADRISIGDLDVRFNFGETVNCWEIQGCDRADCKAYMNFTEQCWFIDGTPCEGYEPRFPEKLAGCRTCEVYQRHRGDRIVQLADSFRHMTNKLKTSRDELVNALDYQNSLIENSFNGIIATDAQGVVTIFNRVAEELTGFSPEEVVGKKSWDHFVDETIVARIGLPLSFGKPRRLRGFAPIESTLKRADGKRVAVRIAGISLYEKGIHLGKVLFFQDLREIMQLRSELIATERLAATGQAAASISHSIKNILGGFLGGVYVFKRGRRLGDPAEMDTGWDMVERNVQIISDLVKDLLNFAKERTPQYETCDPKQLLADAVESVGLSSSENIQVDIEVDEGLTDLMVDVHGFGQCLTNLLKNSAEALDPEAGGTISVWAYSMGDKAILSIGDTGEGMSEETVEKVSHGMYSTKGSKGTGLGLMAVRKIVSEHGGALRIDSRRGEGTVFTIEIPLFSPPMPG